MSTYCVIVPCFNEANRLDVAVFLAFAAAHPEAHFLFVNDGSSDGTAALLARISETQPAQIRALNLPVNAGKAEAIRAGANSLASWRMFDYTGYIDADLSTPLEGITHLRGALERESVYEFALGSRVALLGRQIRRRAARHYLGRVFATAASLLLALPVYDTQCGAKLFRSTLIPEIFSQPFVTRWFFDVEIIFRLLQSRGREQAAAILVEVPLFVWIEKGGSKIRPFDFLSAPWQLVRIWRHYRKGVR